LDIQLFIIPNNVGAVLVVIVW